MKTLRSSQFLTGLLIVASLLVSSTVAMHGAEAVQFDADSAKHQSTLSPTGKSPKENSVEKLMRKMPLIFRNDLVQVVSDKPLSGEQGRQVAEITKRSYEFDRKKLGWQNEKKLSKPITVAIVSSDFMKEHALDYGGATMGNDLIAFKDILLTNSEYQSRIPPHELTHLLVWRKYDIEENDALAKGWNTIWWEGTAEHNSQCFRMQTLPWKRKYPGGRIAATKFDEKVTASDADWLFKLDQPRCKLSASDKERFGMGYPAGRQFIEFLRTRINGTGYSDAMRRIGRMIEEMATTKKSLNDVFPHHFGTEYSDAKKQFIDFLARTQDNPTERFEGTYLELQR